ncbi:MAG: alpha/beta fold hydrolase [Myxococcota bacterium]
MPCVQVGGIEIDYAERGDAAAPAFVLLRGLGTQRIHWPDPLLEGLADRGFRVITPDNRDVGGSQKFEAAGMPDVAGAMARLARGEPVDVPYGLPDMAADVVGLLDALGVERAHLMGMSMGGMVAQHVAARSGERLHSLTSVMSSSGAPDVPPAKPEAMAALLAQPEDPSSRESVVDHNVWVQRTIGSPGYPTDEAVLRERAAAAYDRCHYPVGVARQFLAVLADGSRVDLLRKIDVPTLVIHGEDDPLVPLEGGRSTAEHVRGARLHTIPGMGHDLPLALVDVYVELLSEHARSAGQSG